VKVGGSADLRDNAGWAEAAAGQCSHYVQHWAGSKEWTGF
jgi:hypothetical protein